MDIGYSSKCQVAKQLMRCVRAFGSPLTVMVLVGCASPVGATGKETVSSKPKPSALLRVDALLKEQSLKQLASSEDADVQLAAEDLGKARDQLVAKYNEEIRADARRKVEHEQKKVTFLDKTMRYAYKKVGEKPAKGYPLYIAMHGGGGGPARMNDSQWEHMKRYYLKGVKQGIYLAPRGVTNTWNLHFVKESYACYSRIIENMIVFENVDPNRVYIMGFSAGGDGTYQIPARMPDRWAGAAMSAGHSNGIPMDNYFNLAFLIQVGEGDRAYKRNTVAAQNSVKLKAMRAKHPQYYVNDSFVHVGRGHNFIDYHPTGGPQTVFADSGEWLKLGRKAKMVKKNTNSIHWLDKHVRNPYPKMVIWNQKVSAGRQTKLPPGFWPTDQRGKQCYWIGIDRYMGKAALIADKIIARYDKKTNTVQIDEVGNYVVIYLNSTMLDLSKSVTVKISGKTLLHKPKPSVQTMVRSLLDRGDPSYMFPVRVVLTKEAGGWKIDG